MLAAHTGVVPRRILRQTRATTGCALNHHVVSPSLLHRDSPACLAGARQRGAGSPYRHGAFAPVEKEVLEGDLHVEGELPSALDGMYVRNGPSPHPGVPYTGEFHWCDIAI